MDTKNVKRKIDDDTVDRLVEMIPETLDKITDFIDARTQKAE